MYTTYTGGMNSSEHSSLMFKPFSEQAKAASTQSQRGGGMKENFQLLKKKTQCGDLYTWGSSQDGQLGIEDLTEKEKKHTVLIQEPTKLNLQVLVVKLVCGAGHSLMLSTTNQLYAWGGNLLGQLGLGDTKSRQKPTEIASLRERHLVDLSSGAGHCLVLDSYGVVYSWGASADFQTGHHVEPAQQEGDTK